MNHFCGLKCSNHSTSMGWTYKKFVTLYQLSCYNLGIIPSVDPQQIQQSLSSLSPDDSRKVRRKFRKIWRKLDRERFQSKYVDRSVQPPGPQVSFARRSAVLSQLAMEINEFLDNEIYGAD